ncbi:MAG: ABC transporter permease [Prolixibacteraceae bacterium]|nr:ABC transporter permease [Prolixibacteraceae bacterium]
MFDRDRWIEIWSTITHNKSRSLLTCFGVFWGIFMLVILLGSGNGIKNAMFKNVNGFSTNSVLFIAEKTSLPFKGFKEGRRWNLHNSDVDLINNIVEGISCVSPTIWAGQSDKNVIYKRKSGSYSVKGVNPANFEIESPIIRFGRLFNELDTKNKRKVCLIGKNVSTTLFGIENPCNKYIRVNNIYYKVIGVIKQRGQINIGGRMDDSVLVPFTTLQQTLGEGPIVHLLSVLGKKGYNINKTARQIELLIKNKNKINPDDPKALRIFNISKQFKLFNNLFTGIDILVWLVGLGTLLSGVIGISNIMMVTVKERTKEIGVRRALGASPLSIITQVMSESLVLTTLAGFIGLSFGVFVLDIVDKITSPTPGIDNGSGFLHPGINITVAMIATLILLISGLIAGLIPAWRATKIKAIDALRDE